MADEYDVTVGRARHIFVVLHPACKIDKNKILNLLRELGLDISAVIFLEPGEVSKHTDITGVPMIIPIDGDTCDLPELDDAARYCGQAGARVIVLFAEGYPHESLHPIAEKYGTQCGWSPDQLNGCISGGGDAPRSGSGASVRRPDAGQVKC